jgi:hypothetical protein
LKNANIPKGKRKRRLAIEQNTWQLGYRAGKNGLPNNPPPGCDMTSYSDGYVAGETDRK